MDQQIINCFWLGLVQGLTEFLPISSSGHLVLVQKLFGITNDSMTLEVLLHVGTLFAVFACFWRRIVHMLMHPLRSELPLLALATLPLIAAALLFRDAFGDAFSGEYLGFSFLITTLIFWLADLVAGVSFETKKVRWYNALVMGLMQIVTLVPGVSRSGATIAGGISSGLSRKRAADFAFLMSIPAILGSIVFDAQNIFSSNAFVDVGGWLPLLVGMVTSGVFGFFSIKLMLKLIRRVRLPWFGIYTGLLGVLILMDQYIFHMYF